MHEKDTRDRDYFQFYEHEIQSFIINFIKSVVVQPIMFTVKDHKYWNVPSNNLFKLMYQIRLYMLQSFSTLYC